MLLKLLIALGVIAVAGVLWVRVAPYDPNRWHVAPRAGVEKQTARSYRALRPINAAPSVVLGAILQAAAVTPGTRLMSGDVDSGLMTFQTRSAVLGFPDYTTVSVQDGVLSIYARARFAGYDWGVNRTRVETWLAVLGPLVGPRD